MKEFIIQKNEENQRFDKYLKKLLPNATTSFLYKMMRKKNIVINKKKVEGSEKLKAGDVVSIFLSDETFEKFHVNLEELKKEYDNLKSLNLKGLKVIYEDDEMIVADKPYNMLSQKASGKDLSANEYLLGYMINKGELSFEEFQTFRPSVVNRLDRNTTGLLLRKCAFTAIVTAVSVIPSAILERVLPVQGDTTIISKRFFQSSAPTKPIIPPRPLRIHLLVYGRHQSCLTAVCQNFL